MAITYDAPSTNWQTLTETTSEPRLIHPIYQNLSAIIYEKDFVQNEEYFTPLALGSTMVETQLDGGIDAVVTTITVDSTTGFPSTGKLEIGTEYVDYTGTTSTTFTGCTRGATEGTVTSTAQSHLDNASVKAAIGLIEETSPQQLGGSLIKWTRRFATVPDTWTDYEMRSYTFPGYENDQTASGFRPPYTRVAVWKVVNRYYRTTDAYTNVPVAAHKFKVEDQYGNSIDYVDASSSPTLSSYQSDVSSSTLITVSDSTLERFGGNLWVQKTFQTAAQ